MVEHLRIEILLGELGNIGANAQPLRFFVMRI